MDRVESSSVPDEKGRTGEPMEWAEDDSLANKFSVLVSGNDLGYAFKQWVADIVAGDYDKEQVETLVNGFVAPTSSSSPSPKRSKCSLSRLVHFAEKQKIIWNRKG